LDHVVDLAQERDFGIGLEEEAKDILGQGKDIRTSKELKELRCVTSSPFVNVDTDTTGPSERTSCPTTSRKSNTLFIRLLHTTSCIIMHYVT